MSPTFAHIIREHAANTPHAPALTYEGVTWSFAQPDALSSQSANALLAAGVGPGDRVALLTKNRAECYELLFATNKIGAILVGLNWRLAAPEIAAIVEDARPAVLIVGPGEQALLTDAARSCVGLRRIITLDKTMKFSSISRCQRSPSAIAFGSLRSSATRATSPKLPAFV